MRTTIDLPSRLLRQAKARAALDGTTLKQLVTRWVEQGLKRATDPGLAAPQRQRSELPVARSATGRLLPNLTNADLHQILTDEEIARSETTEISGG